MGLGVWIWVLLLLRSGEGDDGVAEDEGAGEHFPEAFGGDVAGDVAVRWRWFGRGSRWGCWCGRSYFLGCGEEGRGIAADDGGAGREGGEARGDGFADTARAAGDEDVVTGQGSGTGGVVG